MPEVIACPQCQRKLNLRDEFMGSTAKCPSCGAIFIATTALRPALPPPPEAPPRAPDRRLEYERPPSVDRHDRRRTYDDDDDYDLQRGSRSDGWHDDERKRPDRGGAVLALGIVGLVFSCLPPLGLIFGGIALWMGISDLSEMAHGRMSRSGESSTQAGKICGLIAVIISAIVIVLWIVAAASDSW